MAVVVFLRGMNLGSRRITNSDLVTTFQRLGYPNPTPYQASGNVILPDSTQIDAGELEAGLAAELGYEVPVFVRSADQVREIAASPFAGQRGADGGKPQIVFLRRPSSAALAGVFGLDDRHEVIGIEIHWLPPGGLAETGDLHKRLDLAVGPTTVRTLGTIERIVKKLP
ncbi:MAG: DUF1697 domain-containing protein [Acidimicrobiales bacterium]